MTNYLVQSGITANWKISDNWITSSKEYRKTQTRKAIRKFDLILQSAEIQLSEGDEGLDPISSDVLNESFALVKLVHNSVFPIESDRELYPTIFWGSKDGLDICWESKNGKLIIETASDAKKYEYLFKDSSGAISKGREYRGNWHIILSLMLKELCLK